MKAFGFVSIVLLSSSTRFTRAIPRVPSIVRKSPSRLKSSSAMSKNVLGGPLQPCSYDPLTGFYRDGCCNTGEGDIGMHTVCAEVDERFLTFTKNRGNDLTRTIPGMFPGLKPGDRWCVCIQRWVEAHAAGAAPPVVLEATHESALRYVNLSVLEEFAIVNRSTEL